MFKWFWILLLWIRESFSGLFKNIGLNITSLIMITLMLSLFSVSLVAEEYGEGISDQLGDRIEVTINIDDRIDSDNHKEIREELLEMPTVEAVDYITADEAYAFMEKEMGEDVELLYVLESNPFPYQMVIGLKDPSYAERIVETVEEWGISESIVYGQDYIEQVIGIMETIRQIGFWASVTFGAMAIYFVSMVVKYSVMNRKEEIKVKRLTGAGDFTIRFPFVLEVLMINVAAASIVYVGLMYSYERVYEYLIQAQAALPYEVIMETSEVMKTVSPWLFGVAIAVAIFGSGFFVNKSLKKINK